MDSKKVLIETLEKLRSCQSNCDYISISIGDTKAKKIYSEATKSIKHAYDILMKLDNSSSSSHHGVQNSRAHRLSAKDSRIAHHMQEITSISVVDSDDVLRPEEIPEL